MKPAVVLIALDYASQVVLVVQEDVQIHALVVVGIVMVLAMAVVVPALELVRDVAEVVPVIAKGVMAVA